MRPSLVLAVGCFAFAVPALAATAAVAADQVPTFDVRQGCRGGSDGQPAYESCLKSEADARQQLVASWSKYPPAQRQACTSEAGREQPSYVELLTCLQLDQDLKSLPKPDMNFGPMRKID
ncbi:hypothetical protein [Rhodoplanes roseus]|uniref:Secreted protein n=1 Tax=Rhodoplanes roseus TaxID=29409 RepID=A0A327KZV0_9BRAD|nr:hypothetical protein [Rhodoplanes roseus]RAI42762.1 hypothetical protein CH341_17770 [Rhodoplanes roseus]